MNDVYGSNIKIFALNANVELAKQISAQLDTRVGLSEVSTYSDGEISIRINEPVRGYDVFIVQSTSTPVNENIMELLIMIDAMKRASASRITAVIPYYGYARQDRKTRARDPISSKLVANLVTTAGADRVLTMDLHCDQIQGFFDIPVDNLRGLPLFTKYFMNKFPDRTDMVAVSPDLGSVSRVRKFAEKIDVPLAIVDKRRPKANVSEVMNIIGDVKGKTAIMLDDIIDTAGSISNAATALLEKGAVDVYACCTHPVFSGAALERLEKSPIRELVVLNTIYLPEEKQLPKIKILSVADIFSSAIHHIHNRLSVSELFN